LYGLPITGLRFFTVYGPWGRPDMAVYKFTRLMLAGEPIDVFNHGQMKRDFTYIDDVVAGVIQAPRRTSDTNGAGKLADCRLYNIGSNRPVDLRELISTLEECLGVKAKLRYHAMQPGEVVSTHADIDSTKRDLNYRPRTTLRRGIEQFVEWYRDYHRVGTPNGQPNALVDLGGVN
jgi:UDP-glucuronate 4-epimerase